MQYSRYVIYQTVNTQTRRHHHINLILNYTDIEMGLFQNGAGFLESSIGTQAIDEEREKCHFQSFKLSVKYKHPCPVLFFKN